MPQMSEITVDTMAISIVFHSQVGNAVVFSRPTKCSKVGSSVQNGVAFGARQER
jgi:hypothetical protein